MPLTSSLPHFLTSSLPHFLTSSLPHFLTSSLPHSPSPEPDVQLAVEQQRMQYWLQDWCGVEFKGADRLDWLQGQITQDIRQSQKQGFCWCEVTGRLIAFGALTSLDHEVLVFVPRDCLPAIYKRIDEMVILEDVTLTEQSERVVWNPDLNRTEPGHARTAWGTLSLQNEPFTDREFDLLVATHIERGFPQWGTDIGTQSMPFDMGQAFVDATVSFAKGCYMGQEIMARLHASGRQPRDWVGLLSKEPLHPGDRVGEVGRVTSAAQSLSLGHIAAASFSKHKVVKGEMVEVITPTGIVEAEVRHMPLLRLM